MLIDSVSHVSLRSFDIAFLNLLDAILNQVQFEISQRKKEKLWANEL